MIPRIKICCIGSPGEARMAIEAGASAIGLVGHMPSGPGIIADSLIFEISQAIPPHIDTFLLTSETSVSKIINHHRRTQTTAIQLVDALTEGSYQDLRKALPGIKLVQVIHVIDESSVAEALQVSEKLDALLLDSGNPNLQVKELGGTGRTHNWKLSRSICEQVGIPVYLAGGLNQGNIRQALTEVQPYGIDVCSGVRTNGELDRGKLDRFVMEVMK